MSMFKPATYESAFIKWGIIGFTGSGKSFTAARLARGLHQYIKSEKPIAMIDTEGGSDHLVEAFKADDIDLVASKSRSFTDAQKSIKEAETGSDIIICDTMSAIWFDFTETYKHLNRRDNLDREDWNILRSTWRNELIDPYFLCSKIHFIITGRAGFEYQYEENESGKRELMKTGVKMKAEGELGYEPSLLLEMELDRERTAKGIKIINRGTVLKDRDALIHGKQFIEPHFDNFLPLVKKLNLGGDKTGIDISRNSSEAFKDTNKPDWYQQRKKRLIALDLIAEEVSRVYPGQGGYAKKLKADLLYLVFETRSIVDLSENRLLFPVEMLEDGFRKLKIEADRILQENPNAGRSTQRPVRDSVEPKPPRGRPPGSKNKDKKPKRGPGRPPKRPSLGRNK